MDVQHREHEAFERIWCRRTVSGGRRMQLAESPTDGFENWHQGDLSVRQDHDEVAGRAALVARLHRPPSGPNLPPLMDVRLLAAGNRMIELEGYERDVLTRRDTVQTWQLALSTDLEFWCQAIRRDGKPKPRWQLSEGRWVLGELRIELENDQAARRPWPVARLKSLRQDTEVIAPLLDVTLTQCGGDRLILRGTNRALDTDIETANGWLLIHRSRDPQGLGVLQ